MGKVLVIDQGNTRSKITIFQNEEIVESYTLEHLSLETLLPTVEKHKPEGGIYCSVARVDPKFAESLRLLVDEELITFTAHTPVPLEIEYAEGMLGPDRLAAAVGASTLFPGKNILIIDAGTALTCDVVAGSVFKGGNISPGLNMRFRALHTFTGRLPMVEAEKVENLPPFGTDTRQAIQCGVQLGYLNEIKGVVSEARCVYGIEKVAITGGDSPFILESGILADTDYYADRDIVARGLNRIYHYNETI